MHAGAMANAADSVKSQFKRADASGARYALIFGAAELAEGSVALRSLRFISEGEGSRPAQTLWPLDNVDAWANMLRPSPLI